MLLNILTQPSSGYLNFASEYYEQDFDPAVIEHVFNHRPITSNIVSSLNSEIGIEDIREGLDQVGHPQ